MVETRRLTRVVGSVSDRLRFPEGRLVVALSGGADSAALAYLSVEQGRDARALHVNHGLAGSPLMEKAAMNVAEALDLEVDAVTVEVTEGASPEGQARRARYSAFASSVSTGETLVTGHTRDDDVETILLNVIRGTGPRGLTGIPYHRAPNIFRPMLAIERSETREIAGLAGLGFVDDPMNQDPGLTRNILRQRIIPSLRQLNPRLDDSLTRMASIVAGEDAYLESLADEHPVRWGDGTAAAPVGHLVGLARPVADRVLRRMVASVSGESAVTSDRIMRMWSVVDGETARLQLGDGMEVSRRGPMLVLSIDASEEAKSDSRPVALNPGVHTVGATVFEVATIDGPCRVLPLSRWAAVFSRDVALTVDGDGVVRADGEPAWVPGEKRLAVAWYEPGAIGYLSVFAREKTG